MISVSVIIPTYNSKYDDIVRTIDSVLCQTYKYLDVIVVDDGSGVPFSGIDVLYEKENRIKWIKIGENRGVANARNYGAEISDSDFFAFIDSGDWWGVRKIENQINAIRKCGVCDVGMVYSYTVKNYNNGRKVRWVYDGNDLPKTLSLYQCIPGSASSVMIPKKVFKSMGGFFSEYEIPEDRDLWLRIASKYQVVSVNEFDVYLEIAPNSRSSDPVKKLKSYIGFIDKNIEIISKNVDVKKSFAETYYNISKKYAIKRDWFGFFEYQIKSFVRHPSYYMYGIMPRMIREVKKL